MKYALAASKNDKSRRIRGTDDVWRRKREKEADRASERESERERARATKRKHLELEANCAQGETFIVSLFLFILQTLANSLHFLQMNSEFRKNVGNYPCTTAAECHSNSIISKSHLAGDFCVRVHSYYSYESR